MPLAKCKTRKRQALLVCWCADVLVAADVLVCWWPLVAAGKSALHCKKESVCAITGGGSKH